MAEKNCAKKWWLRLCFKFCDCIDILVDYLVNSSVYALIGYVILILYLWFQADLTLDHTWFSLWWACNVKWNHVDHNMSHIWTQVNLGLKHMVQGMVTLEATFRYYARAWSTCFYMVGKQGYSKSNLWNFFDRTFFWHRLERISRWSYTWRWTELSKNSCSSYTKGHSHCCHRRKWKNFWRPFIRQSDDCDTPFQVNSQISTFF